MPYADPARQREFQRNWCKENRATGIQSKQGVRERNRQYVIKSKASPCVDCGQSYKHYIMDYDHRPGEIKVRKVSTLSNQTASLEVLQAEIDKCDLVCANCPSRKDSHSIATFTCRLIGKPPGSDPGHRGSNPCV